VFVFTRFCISFLKNYYLCQTTHTRLTALFPGLYQKGKTNLDFTEARDSEWHWHQLGHMQVSTSLQTDNHASTPPLSFLQAGCPSCRPNNSVKALKACMSDKLAVKPDSAQNVDTVVTSTNTSRRHYAVSSCHSLVLLQGLDLPDNFYQCCASAVLAMDVHVCPQMLKKFSENMEKYKVMLKVSSVKCKIAELCEYCITVYASCILILLCCIATLT